MPIQAVVAGLGLLLILTPAPSSAAEVTVRFVEPEHYIDAGDYAYDAARNLRTLEGHLTKLGGRCLAEGQSLELQVVDVDLAGRREWWHGRAYDGRVMSEISWPRLDLTYVWRDGAGKVLGEGRALVADQNYLWRSAYVRSDADELPYEKAMLRDWFERTLCRKRS